MIFEKLTETSRLKFRFYIGLFAMVIFIAVILAGYGVYKKSIEVILEESMRKNQQKAKAGAITIENILDHVIEQLEQLSKLPEVQESENLRNCVAFRVGFETVNKYVNCLRRIDESGRMVTGYRGKRCELIEKQPAGNLKEAISECLGQRTPCITKTFCQDTGERRILISYPVFSSGRDGESVYRGIIAANIDPRTIEEAIVGHVVGTDYLRYVVIDEDGEVIVTSKQHDMEGMKLSENEKGCVRCHDEIDKISAMVGSGSGSGIITTPGKKEVVISFTEMKHELLTWMVGVYFDYNYIVGSVNSISKYTILMVLVVLLILLPGVYLLMELGKQREEAEERAKYLEKEKRLLEKIREADKEINRHYQELAVLHDLASEVNKTLNLQEVLKISLRKTIEVTAFEIGGIYILDTQEKAFKLKDQVGVPDEAIGELESIDIDHSLTGVVAKTGELVFVESIVDDERCKITSLKRLGYHSYAGIPLMHGAKLLGIMNLSVRHRVQLDEGERKWLKSIGSIIGMAIGNCLLYQDVTKRATEMGILYEVGNVLTGTVERTKLGEIVIEILKSRLDYPACTLMILDKENNELYIEATSYDMEETFRSRRFEVGKNGVTGCAAYKKEPVYVPDVTVDDRYMKGREEARSELSIPLVFGDELLGVLDFEKDEKNGFSEDERKFLSLFATQVSGALYNITMFEETIRMNQELNLLSERKSEFVSLVSHELRTPLTAIKSSIDIILLRMKENVDENVAYFLKIAKANVDRLSNMIDNILDISRIESGRMQFSYEVLNIKEPASKAINNVAPLAMQKDLQLEDRIEEDLPEVYADSGKVEQILTNLIGNAIKFTPKGGKITVEASKKSVNELGEKVVSGINNGHREFIQVTVQDTGPGIPEGERENIFKRFKRIEKRGGKGTGLGLAISKYLVESHGGGIWVESEVGKGSSFNFLIPVYSGETDHSNQNGNARCN